MMLTRRIGVEPRRRPNGDYFIRLDPGGCDRLPAMRGLGESSRDVILRLRMLGAMRAASRP